MLKKQKRVTGCVFNGVEVVLDLMKFLVWRTAHRYQNIPTEAEGPFGCGSRSEDESKDLTKSQLSPVDLSSTNLGELTT